MKKNIIINTGFVLALLIILSIMLVSHRQMTQLAIYEEKEDFTFNVIQSLDSLLKSLRDVRADQNNFIKSGDEKYQDLYHKAFKESKRELESLESLAKGQPWLQKRLVEIEPLVKDKLTEFEERIKPHEGQGFQAAGNEEVAGKARVAMAEIRRQVSAAKYEAVSRMRELTGRQEADFRKMEWLLVTISSIIFILVSLIFLLLRRDIAGRIRNEQDLIKRRDQLDELVKSRTQELLHANQDLKSEIKERERIEEALRFEEKKYRSLFENSLDAVLLAAPEGKITSVNRAACGMFGMAEEEIIEVGFRGITDPMDNRLATILEEQAHRGNIMCELDFLRKDGSRFPAEVSSAVLADGTNSFVMIHDITERKWAEQIRRNLNEHEDAIQEQERLAISREVHDEIGQNLTALKLDLSWIEHRFPPGNSDLAGRLREMRTNLDQLIVKAQHITAELRPPLLDNLGLAAAIEWQVREFTRRSGIECHLMLNEGIEIYDQHTASTIMRICQETLTNIIRHARATEVSISLCERDNQVVLEVSDNGRGITMAEIESPTAYGIMGMRERAHLCRGKLTISGKPGEGTTIFLAIPRDVVKEEI